jgi:hypothetical protein
MSLTTYLNDTKALLHDQSSLFTSTSQLIRWVNEARRSCAKRTGCIMRHVTGQSAFGASAQPGSFVPGGAQPGALPGAVPASSGLAVAGAAVNSLQTIPGQERYPYVGFFNPYVQQTYAGVKGIIDVASCSVNWGGAVRPSLAWLPWEDLQAYARAYSTLVTSYPYYWSVLNDGEVGEVWLFPAPSTTGDIELYAYCVPKDIYTDDDYDAIPEQLHESIKFLAASLAYMTKQQYAQAQVMEGMYAERAGIAHVAVDRGKTPSYYWSAF